MINLGNCMMFRKIAAGLNPPELKGASDFKSKANKRGLWVLFNASLLLNGGNVLLQSIFGHSVGFGYAIFLLVVTGVGFVPFLLQQRKKDFNALPMLYMMSLVLGTLSVVGDTLFNPDEASFMAIFMLFLIPQLFLDAPWKACLLETGIGLFHIACCLRFKSGMILEMDMIRGLLVTITALIFGMSRIKSNIRIMSSHTNVQAKAEHDPLTGVFNRAGGEGLIREQVDRQLSGSFAIMDIDNFKHVNDMYGHQTGDRVLVEVGQVLTHFFRSSDVIVRIGGDEFVVYAIGLADRASLEKKLEQVCEGMRHIMLDEEKGEHVTISMGCVVNDGTYPSLEALYSAADRMLYKVKESGKDGFQILNISYRG